MSSISELRRDAIPMPRTEKLETVLLRAANTANAGEIVLIGPAGESETLSYVDLLESAQDLLATLKTAGVHGHDRVLIQTKNQRELLSGFWACQLGGIVPVPVSPRPAALSGVSATGLRETVVDVTGAQWVLSDNCELTFQTRTVEQERSDLNGLAALMLTSGSTGSPKAVRLTHRNILSRCIANQTDRPLSSASRTLNWMPLDHVGGLIMFHVRDVMYQCHQVHVDSSWILDDPTRWMTSISDYRCDTTWASNSSFGQIIDSADRLRTIAPDLSCLRYVMNGGEPVAPSVLTKFVNLLSEFGMPENAIFPGWGMTETSSGVVDRQMTADDLTRVHRFVSLGTPHPGVAIRVVSDNNTLVPEGCIGQVQVAGEPVTSGYFGNEAENAKSFTTDGWFTTGDLAYISHGELFVTGRAEDLITLDNANVYAHEVENAISELAFASYSFVCACVVDNGLNIVYSSILEEDSSYESAAIKGLVKTRFGLTVARVVRRQRRAIPKTGVGKMVRKQVAAELRDMNSDRDLRILQAISINGKSTLAKIAAASGIQDDLEADLAAAISRNLCFELDGIYGLTLAGKEHLRHLLQIEKSGVDAHLLDRSYVEFGEPNHELKSLITYWQMIDGKTVNTHADSIYDASVISKLLQFHSSFLPKLSAMIDIVPRLASYRDRLNLAVTRIESGDHRWIVHPLLESYHSVWFELHEELIRLAGRSRADEHEQAGTHS